MLIDLLLTSDNIIKAKKTFQTIDNDVNAIPTAPINELEPTVIVDYSENYLKANYIYIDLYKRYYKILEKISDIGKKIKFICAVDSVTSWIDYLQNCDITVIRNEGIGKPTKINDNKLPISPNEKTVEQVPVTDYNVTDSKLNSTGIYILQCIGGVSNGN